MFKIMSTPFVNTVWLGIIYILTTTTTSSSANDNHINYIISTKTGSKAFYNVLPTVDIILFGANGETLRIDDLDGSFKNGGVDTFNVSARDIRPIEKIQFKLHGRFWFTGWPLEYVSIKVGHIQIFYAKNRKDIPNLRAKTHSLNMTNEGYISKYCNVSGAYQDPVYNCTRSSIAQIYRKLIENKNKDHVYINEILDNLSNATSDTNENNTLLIGDIATAIEILELITDVFPVNSTRLDNITDSYIQTVNNILDESTTQTWKAIINMTGSGADSILKTTDRFVEKILTSSKNVTVHISKPNLYLNMGSVQFSKNAFNFPKRENEDIPDWARSRKDRLEIDCDSTVESFSGIMYRNLSMIIPSSTNNTMSEDLQLNAPVISFTLYPNHERRLASPVKIKFQLYNKTLDNARCSFWKEPESKTSQGFWSDKGCRQETDGKNKDFVVCVCDHLTNFALLMSPSSSPINEDHTKALSLISKIGCIVSMIFLVLSVAIHAFFWRFVKSVQTIVHTNLSCWLIVAYILFLVGFNRTENKDICTAFAVLLHFVFLVVFFGMLTEGCSISFTVLKPLSSRKPGIPLMIASYVVAVIIVVISMGVTQLHGYGSEQACWLSTETGLIWAFLVPVFVVVLINLIMVVLVLRTMCGTAAMAKKSNKGRAIAALRCILVLMPLMGLTWGFGALSMNNDTVIFQYIFAVLNSFQGLLIFIFHCLMNKKIKDTFSKQKSKWLKSQMYDLSEVKKNKTQDMSMKFSMTNNN
ncbi:adhesion G protein-coupled receptor B3-like isoform X2 [Ruditapes philippinarum]|uniref:adhesion G protein-coupled receptor B3-like isoform X2 n=1 Tax=Ruditapes philippinarum TaxID=129788 RepID=UPI00295A7A77|nr:adhesion G protein-coupled receptor B3-like isoform X2 [Ruditapes philippinarum]